MRSSLSAVGGATTASASPTRFSSVVSQAAAINAFRSRLLSPSPASSVADTEEELDLSSASLPPLAPSAGAAADQMHAQHSRHHACDSCSELETEFAAAVLFVETYSGAS